MESVFARFPSILNELESNPDAREAFVMAAWRRTAGERLNEHTTPVTLVDGRLRVAVRNKTWAKNLEPMAAELLARLNLKVNGEPVKFIEFFIDEKLVKKPKVINEGSSSAIDDETRRRLKDSASAIADEDLRKKFLAAAEESLNRKLRLALQK